MASKYGTWYMGSVSDSVTLTADQLSCIKINNSLLIGVCARLLAIWELLRFIHSTDGTMVTSETGQMLNYLRGNGFIE